MPVGYFYGQARFFSYILHTLADDMAAGGVRNDHLEAKFGEEGFPQGEEFMKE